MTTEIELLPLPEWMSRYTIPSDGFECDKVAMLDDRMHDYARENVAHHTAALQAEIEGLRAEVERLSRYYKNGIDCFANPCERHSGERTPPFAEFFEKYGGQCLICVVDNNKALQAENERLRAEVDALRLNDASVQPELVAVALAACDAVDDLIEKWYATRESGCLPNQVVRAMGASKLLRAIALEDTK